MLKALQLAGFKSFADKTRFHYPPGVTVVVGPNGSGKSNVVDAVKWVLGSQSAKSLRGQEMTDVIFNGCGSRGPLNAAEVTITLDNQSGWLDINAPEVHLTRRVYRSGEGEYLINRQACRLRDIRDLLAGTGLMTHAYSIIEQGRVDFVLQSSPRDRRVIFEEAAGISRFRTKQAEAARRLERVEQNLLRLSDIVDEVESRLRSVRMQAGKARRYRELVSRLQDLRTHVGLSDWRVLSEKLTNQQQELELWRRRADAAQQQLSTSEQRVAEAEARIENEEQQLRQIEKADAANREQIAVTELTIKNHQARTSELEQVIARHRRQLVAMTTSASTHQEQTRDQEEEFQAAEEAFAAADRDHRHARVALEQVELERDTARDQLEQLRTKHMEATRAAAQLHNHVSAREAQLQSAETAAAQTQGKLDQVTDRCSRLAADLAHLEETERELAHQTGEAQENARRFKRNLNAKRHELEHAETKLQRIDGQLNRTRERVAVLEELEQRLEDLASGVKHVLTEVGRAPDGPFAGVRGMVADLFHVDVDTAPLVEVALGQKAEYVVVASGETLVDWLQGGAAAMPGRVSFLRLDCHVQTSAFDRIDLAGEPGVIGRADQFVETDPEFAALARLLLSHTWFVDTLDTAMRLANTDGRGLNFVTSDGYLLDAENTLTVGPRLTSAGRLSRRSELRACHDQISELDRQKTAQRAIRDGLKETIRQWELTAEANTQQVAELSGRLTEQRHRAAAARDRLDHASAELKETNEQLQQALERSQTLRCDLADKQHELEQSRALVDRLATELDDAAANLTACDRRWTELHADLTQKQVAAAKLEQRVDILRGQMEQAARDQQERQRAVDEKRQQLDDGERQLAECQGEILTGNQRLAELRLARESFQQQLQEQADVISATRRLRGQLNEEIRKQQQELSGLQTRQQQLALEINRLGHERDTLCERMSEDYGIDLAAAATGESQQVGLENRSEIEQEIADLRHKVNSIGAVNLDALEELDELEARFAGLSQQYEDLVEAKATLQRIIQRINIDSRQLFLTTLDVIRGHFRELFRRLFGGGEADIVIDDETGDVLESGIDIAVCPPGKETCNISLLSGGERTLTCVALLLAVFRSKPSPFCVLDEVDAALDESNINRFMSVLREFLSSTQFVVITHSKKTMFGADTLYGVTMQESGVSKQVSVRLEDVSEDGHIRIRHQSDGQPDDATSDDEERPDKQAA